MNLSELLKFCPHCGNDAFQPAGVDCFVCGACDFHFFINPATAAGGLIVDGEGRVLLVRRAKDPARGKFGLPGGFVDAGESIEDALRREIREEVNLELQSFEYLCSFPNQYHYRGTTYSVVDLFFVCHVPSFAPLQTCDEVESYCFLPPEDINLDDVAFPSVRRALEMYAARLPAPQA